MFAKGQRLPYAPQQAAALFDYFICDRYKRRGTSGALGAINEIGSFGRRMRRNQAIFSAAPVALTRSTVMLHRLLRLFVFVAAAVILAASPARAAAEKVPYTGDAKPGTIVIQSEERSLYLITGKDQALKYSVGVGRTGKQWFGTTRIASKHIRPAWKPPASLRGKRSPDFYIEGGSPQNPMGAAALVLVHSELAIHGTNNPGSIGGLVSAGCIRMHNKDIMDLYGRVHVGTRVVFVK
jgi:lipoprotein-anchoring transpeptidase ErfK/SrfK